MNKKKAKVNIIFVLIIIILIISALMIRFEVNPFSYFLGEDEEEVLVESTDNSNGIYRYREALDKTRSMFHGCTVIYFDNYILIINDKFYLYRESCIGTFYLGDGNTKTLKINETLEKNKYITYNGKDYYKNDTLDTIDVHNFVKENDDDLGAIYPENYNLLLQESQRVGDYFNLEEIEIKTSPAAFYFNLHQIEGNLFDMKITNMEEKVLYETKINGFNSMPLFRGYGSNLVVIEPISNGDKYQYGFKVINAEDTIYDLKSMFPITVDGDTLSYERSVYVTFNPSENEFVMLVGKDKQMCVKNSDSNDVAYYVFYLKYDYSNRNFKKPVFIKKVYERDGCKYANEVMGW